MWYLATVDYWLKMCLEGDGYQWMKLYYWLCSWMNVWHQHYTQLQVLMTGYLKGYDILPPIVPGEWFRSLAFLTIVFYNMCFTGDL